MFEPSERQRKSGAGAVSRLTHSRPAADTSAMTKTEIKLALGAVGSAGLLLIAGRLVKG